MFSVNHINTHVFMFHQDIYFLRRFFTLDCLGVVFPNHAIHKPIHNYKLLNGRVGLSWSYCATYTGIFSSKILSQAWDCKSPSSNSEKSSKGQSAKASARTIQNDNSKPSISLHNVVDVTSSMDHLLGGGMQDTTSRITRPTVNNNSQHPNKKETTGPHSENKKQNEKASSATVSSEADQSKGSGRVSLSKQPSNARKGKPSPASVNKSAGGLLQGLDSSLKTSKPKSKRKGKHSKEVITVKKSVEPLSKPGQNDKKNSCNKSLRKQESHIVNITEPQETLELKQLYPPTGNSLLVVESLAKKDFIQGYLGGISKKIRKGKILKKKVVVKKSDEALAKPGQNDNEISPKNKSQQKHKSNIDNIAKPQAIIHLKKLYPSTEKSAVVVESFVKESFEDGLFGGTSKESKIKGKHLKDKIAVKKNAEAHAKPGKNDVQISCNNVSPQKQNAHIDGNRKHKKPLKFKQLYPPTGKSVVVVESLTKAKVIQGYLGSMYKVVACFGHVRDLAARSGSVRPDDGFSMLWEVRSSAWTHLKNIIDALTRAENLILASDPDREGEAIAWHIVEMLQQQGVLHKVSTVARVVFHEITESAIKSALEAPRNINDNLVNAYLARKALDYLIGFNISPLLWRKLPGCQSAGRVQSAALAIISDRETEIDKFEPEEYWTIEAEFKGDAEANSLPFHSILSHVGSEKLSKLSIKSHAKAMDIRKKFNSLHFVVVDSKRSTSKRNPPAPYITSTLQQDSASKLHFTATVTMKLAQKLYEGVQLACGKTTGLITYMRTDGLNISNEAAIEIHSFVVERYGQNFAAKSPLKYFKKVKNSQEAHEAIRPTDIRLLPSMLKGTLDKDSLKLYGLIWSRTMACQMVPASIDQIHLDIGTSPESFTCQSACSKSSFLGYRAASKDEEAFSCIENENEGNAVETFEALSSLKTGDQLHLHNVELKQHHTQPPPRYSEASLVKKLEDLGIGRPSTYASTIKVLQDRNYVTTKSRLLHPEFRGRMVSAYLSHHFSEVTNYSFTADMESQLDKVSAGTTQWKGLLDNYWKQFSFNCDLASHVPIHQVEKMLDVTFGDILFSCFVDKSRKCPSCMLGTLIFKVSRFGAGYFIGCDRRPKCKFIARASIGSDAAADDDVHELNPNFPEQKLLGHNPGSNEEVLLKRGPYGFYLQLGENRKGHTPKRTSLSAVKDVNSLDLEKALELLRFPLALGNHPKDNQPVDLRLSNKGYSVKHRQTIAFVPKNLDPSDVTLEEALKLLASKDAKRFGRQKNKLKNS